MNQAATVQQAAVIGMKQTISVQTASGKKAIQALFDDSEDDD